MTITRPYPNTEGHHQHSYRFYPPDFFRDLWKNAETEEEKEKVRVTLKHMEDRRFYDMLKALHEFTTDITTEAQVDFFDSNPRMKTWLDIYRDAFGMPHQVSGNGESILNTTPQEVRKVMESEGKREARVMIRDMGSGFTHGSFSKFLDKAHKMVVALDRDEIESFFSSNPRMKSWIQIFAETEHLNRLENY